MLMSRVCPSRSSTCSRDPRVCRPSRVRDGREGSAGERGSSEDPPWGGRRRVGSCSPSRDTQEGVRSGSWRT